MKAMLEHLSDRASGRVPAGSRRSPEWPEFRRIHMGHECQACGSRGGLQLHHRVPFHLDPARELDPHNVITLCRTCHLLIGHLRSFKSYNIEVLTDAADLRAKIKKRP